MEDTSTIEALEKTLALYKKCVVHCGAEWSEPSKQMHMVCKELASMHPNLHFMTVDVEQLTGFQEEYKINAVPHFLFFEGGKLTDELSGADPAALMEKVDTIISKNGNEVDKKSPSETTNDRIEKLLNSQDVLLFMKGSPSAPRCGFSSKVVNVLNEDKINFAHFDILQDEEIRQGLKEYSCWPTYPQLYAKGELIGGGDIVLELHAKGELLQNVKAKIDS